MQTYKEVNKVKKTNYYKQSSKKPIIYWREIIELIISSKSELLWSDYFKFNIQIYGHSWMHSLD